MKAADANVPTPAINPAPTPEDFAEVLETLFPVILKGKVFEGKK
ncbi:hypothetical protein N027_25540 [Pseudomonas syringae USA007]|uniref:Uncharacterized protein n=1 Tax=Pseudomonas syringae USA007 TaxID=1357288 RepID=A0AAU8M851_PSESX|nr:hypothetical protein [Pseudomonas syringae]